jgi:hypothetical protein
MLVAVKCIWRSISTVCVTSGDRDGSVLLEEIGGKERRQDIFPPGLDDSFVVTGIVGKLEASYKPPHGSSRQPTGLQSNL